LFRVIIYTFIYQIKHIFSDRKSNLGFAIVAGHHGG